MDYIIAEDGQALEALMHHEDFPKTYGELTLWLCDIIDHNIGSCNTGNGIENDVLFRCLQYIEKHEGKIHIPQNEWQ